MHNNVILLSYIAPTKEYQLSDISYLSFMHVLKIIPHKAIKMNDKGEDTCSLFAIDF